MYWQHAQHMPPLEQNMTAKLSSVPLLQRRDQSLVPLSSPEGMAELYIASKREVRRWAQRGESWKDYADLAHEVFIRLYKAYGAVDANPSCTKQIMTNVITEVHDLTTNILDERPGMIISNALLSKVVRSAIFDGLRHARCRIVTISSDAQSLDGVQMNPGTLNTAFHATHELLTEDHLLLRRVQAFFIKYIDIVRHPITARNLKGLSNQEICGELLISEKQLISKQQKELSDILYQLNCTLFPDVKMNSECSTSQSRKSNSDKKSALAVIRSLVVGSLFGGKQ